MQIILASQSPRRSFLLNKMGLKFTVIPSDYEEFFDPSAPVDELASTLALGKARAVAALHPEAIVIGADTIVAFQGKQLGKPKDADEARKVLKSYEGKSCDAISAIAVVCPAKKYEKASSDVTHLVFGSMPDGIIDQYLITGNYADKAGSFAMQHPLIRPRIKQIDGRIDTVVGMQTEMLAALLRELEVDCHGVDLSDDNLLEHASMAD